jgi:nitroreductase
MDIKTAVDISNRAQRNYDLTKSIPQEDLDTLIYAAANSPSKQNELHYSLNVSTDSDINYQIYEQTKKFTLYNPDNSLVGTIDKTGNYNQDNTNSVTNSQILANAIFVYHDAHPQKENNSHQINLDHALARSNPDNTNINKNYNQQRNYSVGISVGELILTAGLLGYRTGICSAFDGLAIKNILGSKTTPSLLVGIGYDNPNMNRLAHPHVLNKDVPEGSRNGHLYDNWNFPTNDKDTEVKLNGVNFRSSKGV